MAERNWWRTGPMCYCFPKARQVSFIMSVQATYDCCVFRCGGDFCTLHRCAEAHGCSFDYKTEGRRGIERSNPVIAADKLPKIWTFIVLSRRSLDFQQVLLANYQLCRHNIAMPMYVCPYGNTINWKPFQQNDSVLGSCHTIFESGISKQPFAIPRLNRNSEILIL